MPGPLEGVLIVALEQAVAAPYCTSRLADAGARVIKIERAEGDFARGYDRAAEGTSSYFAWLNRGKESLVLDVKAPGDRALLDALLVQADVFVQNLAPGAVDRLGLSADTLRAARPEMITCDISSYGSGGPYAERKGYDLLLQAETGLVSITGTPEGAGRVGVSVCDIATGMSACQGILEALIARGAYACADGSELLVSIQNEREWASFCADVLGQADLAADPRFADNSARVANRPALDVIVREAFGRHPRAALIQILDRAKIAFGAVNTVLELRDHPHLRRASVATPNGSVEIVAPPVVSPDRPFSPGGVPSVGQHTDAIRAEFLGG